MKKFALLILLAISATTIFAQHQNEDSTMSRKEKRKAELEKQFQYTKEMLESKNFVLESDFIQNRYGQRTSVSSSINFVKVDSSEAVIQIGSNHRIGPNGVGGVTAKGRITNWEMETNEKKKMFRITMTVMTNIGTYDVHFSINPHRQATARLSGMRASGLTFDGDIVALNESAVYEGQSY